MELFFFGVILTPKRTLKMAAYENELDRKECGFINSLRVKRVNNNDKRILNCLGFTYNM